MHKIIGLTAVMVALAVTAVRGADSYSIRLSVPYHPGDVSAVLVKVKRTHSEKWSDGRNDNKPIETSLEAELEGTETIEAVTTHGRAMKLTFKVTKCTKDGQELLPKGTTILAENVNFLTQFQLEGAALTDDQRSVLKILIFAGRPDEPSTDEELGTAKPQRMGDTWPVNGDALAKATHLSFHVVGTDFKGHAKLLAVNTLDGKLTETIQETHVLEFDRREGLHGSIYQNFRRKQDFTSTVPIDVTTHQRSDAFTADLSATFTDSKGTRDIHDEFTMTQTEGAGVTQN
jgi:hypothetical protein